MAVEIGSGKDRDKSATSKDKSLCGSLSRNLKKGYGPLISKWLFFLIEDMSFTYTLIHVSLTKTKF